ncbi:MAG: protein kinase, partial [Bacteroidota bacterium]
MIGQTISHYKILEKLGEGGMGVVYKAEDIRLNRPVALKFLPLQKTITKDDSDRFIREARAAARLNHPNIATIFDFHELEDPSTHSTLAFIAMEYVEGRTLGQLLREGPLLIEKVVAIGMQLAEALAIAHQRGIVHRDLKPANIIVTPGDTVKILDFGVAKLLEEDTRTSPKSIAGSAMYMSPEQVQGAHIDHRSDLFSLGVVLYEMVTGKRPFQGEHNPAVFYSITNTNPLPPSKSRPDVPGPLETIILRLLEKDTSKRFQRASDLRDALSQLSPRRTQSNNRYGSGFVRRHRQSISTSLVLLAAVVFTTMMLSRNEAVEPGVNVAVIQFDNYTGDAALYWMTRGIADMVITDLSQSRYLSVVPLDRITNLIPASQTESTESWKFEAARQASANILVTGSVMKAGDRLRVLTKVFDLRSGQTLSSEHVEGSGSEQFFQIADEIARRVRLVLEIEATAPGEKNEIVQARTHSAEAYKEYTLGGAFIEKQYYEDAIRHLQRAVELDSTFARAHNSLSHVYDVLGERSLAEASIQKAIRFSNGLPEIDRTMIALQYAQLRGDWNEEFRLVQQLLLRQPYEPAWHFRLGWHYFAHQRNYEQSVYHYLRALEIDSTRYPLTYHYLGHVYLNWGKGSEAVDAFSRHASLRPDDALAQEALGVAYRLTGNYGKAKEQFNLALKLKPTFSSALMNLGILAKEEGRNRDAEKYFQNFLSRGVGTSDKLDGHYQLARFHLELGRPLQARTEIMRCLDVDSTFIPALWILGLSYVRAGDLESAAAVMAQLDRLELKFQSKYQKEFSRHLRGAIFLEAGRHDDAIKEFQAALDLGPMELPFFRYSLARAYERTGRNGLAIETYDKVLENNPGYASAHISLASMYAVTRDSGKIVFHCERVLDIR